MSVCKAKELNYWRCSLNGSAKPPSNEALRGSTVTYKIFYAKSRLTLGKRADNLIRAYRTNKVYNLTSFYEYRKKLRELYGDRFKAKKARNFLRSTR